MVDINNKKINTHQYFTDTRHVHGPFLILDQYLQNKALERLKFILKNVLLNFYTDI